MDAPCKIQGSIHVFRLVNNMCPGKWVHIILAVILFFVSSIMHFSHIVLITMLIELLKFSCLIYKFFMLC